MMKAPQPPGAPSPHVSHTHCDRHGHHNLSGARIDRQEAQLARFCIPRCAAVTRADNAALRDRERGTRWKIGREGLLRFRIAPVHHCGTPTEVSQRPSQAGSESSGTGGPRNGLSGQNLTSGANSPDPAQDSQASDQKGLPVPGRPFSLLARRGSLLAFPRGVQAMNREREIQIIAEEICAQVPGAMLSVNKVPHGSSHRHL